MRLCKLSNWAFPISPLPRYILGPAARLEKFNLKAYTNTNNSTTKLSDHMFWWAQRHVGNKLVKDVFISREKALMSVTASLFRIGHLILLVYLQIKMLQDIYKTFLQNEENNSHSKINIFLVGWGLKVHFWITSLRNVVQRNCNANTQTTCISSYVVHFILYSRTFTTELDLYNSLSRMLSNRQQICKYRVSRSDRLDSSITSSVL